jgi:uncharacterized protein (UPF0548 family)
MRELTYPEVGGTRAEPMPAGYHHVIRREKVGEGADAYCRVVDGLRRWDLQRRAGLRVPAATPPPAVGVRMTAAVPGLSIPCQVVWVVDEDRRYGYGYGTLPGHPESGEEAFVASLDDADRVWLDIRAFSRPDRWFTRLAGPLARLAQGVATRRYLSAAGRIAQGR